MNAQKFLAAAALFAAAGSVFAGDAPAVVAASAAATVAESTLPAVTITTARSRAEVRAEAIEFVKNYKTTLAVQLEQYK